MFLPKIVTDRTVLLSRDDLSSTAYNQSGAGRRYVYKNALVSEVANLGNMSDVATNISALNSYGAFEAAKFMLLRLSSSLAEIVKRRIIHGDLKMENIFMKTCDPLDPRLDATKEFTAKFYEEKNKSKPLLSARSSKKLPLRTS